MEQTAIPEYARWPWQLFLVIQIALTCDHDTLGLRGASAVHRLGAIANRHGTKAKILNPYRAEGGTEDRVIYRIFHLLAEYVDRQIESTSALGVLFSGYKWHKGKFHLKCKKYKPYSLYLTPIQPEITIRWTSLVPS